MELLMTEGMAIRKRMAALARPYSPDRTNSLGAQVDVGNLHGPTGSEDSRYMLYYGVGMGGPDSTTYRTNLQLPMPVLVRSLSKGPLPPERVKNYHLRKVGVHNGIRYEAYYLKRIEDGPLNKAVIKFDHSTLYNLRKVMEFFSTPQAEIMEFSELGIYSGIYNLDSPTPEGVDVRPHSVQLEYYANKAGFLVRDEEMMDKEWTLEMDIPFI